MDADDLQLAIHRCLEARLHGADIRIRRALDAMLQAVAKERRLLNAQALRSKEEEEDAELTRRWNLDRLEPLVLQRLYEQLLRETQQDSSRQTTKATMSASQRMLNHVDEAMEAATKFRKSARQGVKNCLCADHDD